MSIELGRWKENKMKAKFRIKNNKITGIYVTGSANIPNGVTSIGRFAFSCCDKLTSIVIPEHFTDEDPRLWGIPDTCKVIIHN